MITSTLIIRRKFLRPTSLLRTAPGENRTYSNQRRASHAQRPSSVLTEFDFSQRVLPNPTQRSLQSSKHLYSSFTHFCYFQSSIAGLSDPSRQNLHSTAGPTSIPDCPVVTSLQSGFGFWTAGVTVVCSFVILLLHTTISGQDKKQSLIFEVLCSENPENEKGAEDFRTMTGESQPGRPGTLTADEEEKLRELWIAVLQVFGVLDNRDPVVNGNVDPGTGPVRSDTSVSAKKTKKKRGLFRKKESDATAVTASELGGVVTEDKYGQTKEFHEALANQSPASLRAAFWGMVKHDHPDALLLRFLRARKWNVENALVMMVSTMRWRSKEMHVDDDIMKHGELGALEDTQGSDHTKKRLGEDFLQQMRMGKSFLHGLDRDDRPVTIVRARLHKQGEQSEESLERYTVYLIESARMTLSPPVDTACIIFDMTGFSLANMDYHPVKFMIKCFEANYPESLGVVLVHKAPWIFQGIWKIIRGWLDPVVASKVQFTNGSTELESFIPPDRIIRELAGPEDWSYTYIEPVPGENDRMKDTETRDKLLKQREVLVDEYESVVLQWINSDGESQSLDKKRHEVAAALREDYWALDPYVRARSYYDRVGLINPGGVLNFYPSTRGGAKPPVGSSDDID